MKKLLLVFSMLMLITGATFAQRSISGTVTDDKGEALLGASILVKGTSTGTITDFDGKYTLSVPADGKTLVVSYTGFDTREIDLGVSDIVDIVLAEGVALQTIVITALGIEKDEKAIGYAVQAVDGDAIVNSGATSAIDALRGQAAGVNVVRSSGAAGGGSNIIIRGSTSMTGNNQALFVVDGVRINNSTLYTEARTAGTAQTSRAMDINPDDIASISILKGAAATALYGVDGANGVILITTKRGSSGRGIEVTAGTSITYDQITNMPALQSVYAQGWAGAYRAPESGSSTSWGPRIDTLAYDGATDYDYDPNGRIVGQSDPSAKSPAKAYDNINNFFKTGVTYNHNVAISGGDDKASFRLSMSALNQDGIIPNNTYDRYTVKLTSDLKVSEKIKIAASVNYTLTDNQKVQQGSNTSGLLLGMLRTPASFDNANGVSDPVNDNGSYVRPNGTQRNYRGGGGYDNPFWTVNNALGNDQINRLFGNIKIDYAMHQWANLALNVGTDVWSDNRKQRFEIGSRTAPGGRIIEDQYFFRNSDVYFTLAGNGDISEDFSMGYILGTNLYAEARNNSFSTGNGFSFPGFVHISNAGEVTSGDLDNNIKNAGFFLNLDFAYKGMLYLGVTGRKDYSSSLIVPTKEFNANDISFFYPSANLGFVFSELMESNVLSFGKLRLSYAQVGGGAPSPYRTSTPFVGAAPGDGWSDGVSFPFSGQTGFTKSNSLGNTNLRPELSTTLEAGIDLRFFNGRLGLDATYYTRQSEDQIIPVSLAGSTGYTSAFLNAGLLSTKGFEVVLNLTPIKTKDFTWNATINFDQTETIVERLVDIDEDGEDDIKILQIGGFTASGLYHVVGNPYSVLFGGSFLREGAGGADDDGVSLPGGAIIINSNPDDSEYGYGKVDPTLRVFGNPAPDFTVGMVNSIRYKKITLDFVLDWKQGGQMWNGTEWALSFFGRSQLTADTRTETPTALEGVTEDGSVNTIAIVRDHNYWTSSNGGFGDVREQFTQSTTWFRLRSIKLAYNLDGLFKGNVIKGGSIYFNGRNLWFTTPYSGVDPETSLTGVGNAQGFDYFNMPSTKSFTFGVNLRF